MKQIKISLKVKVIGVVLVVALVLACAATLVSYNIYAKTMDTHYETLAMNLAKTAASMIDKKDIQTLTDEVMDSYRSVLINENTPPDFDNFTSEDWDQYYNLFTPAIHSAAYASILDVLTEIKQSNDVLSIYVCYMDEKSGKAVYILDASDPDNACLPGDCDDIESGNLQLMNDGIFDFPAYITNYEQYGWLCSAAAAIHAENGEVIANAYVDISMNNVMKDRHEFLTRLLLILAAATIALIILLVLIITKTVVRPINKLAQATGDFVSEKEKGRKSRSTISQLEIHTGDEIENLSYSIKKMEKDINTYINDLSRVTAEKERIGAELNVATQIQASMLPCIFPAFPGRKEFDIYATMTPAKEVGGDFYDFFLVDDDHLALVMADVSGKGVPAALFMVIAKTLIKNAAQTGLSPKAVLEKVNNQLCENNEAEMFVTVWFGVYEISTGKLIAANAGHEYPAVKRAGGKFELLKDKHGFVLAGFEGARYREYVLDLKAGDTIFVYTDGVTEATDTDNVLYGTDRMLSALNGTEDAIPEKLLQKVKADIDAFKGDAPQFDDITMLALKVKSIKADSMKRISIAPSLESIDKVTAFLEQCLENQDVPVKAISQINIAADEIFSNIARYSGATTVSVGCETKNNQAIIRFADNGRPYDPTEKADPDITLSAEQRDIGGLGIFMVKKTMDEIVYEYEDGFNILTIRKGW